MPAIKLTKDFQILRDVRLRPFERHRATSPSRRFPVAVHDSAPGGVATHEARLGEGLQLLLVAEDCLQRLRGMRGCWAEVFGTHIYSDSKKG